MHHAIIRNGYIESVILWDGTTPWTPPAGSTVMPLNEAKAAGFQHKPQAVQPPSRKVWPTNAHFWGEFTPAEQTAIAARPEGPIRALIVTFTVWPGEMWSDDERVQKAMQALVAVGAITPGRAEEILHP